MAIHRIRPHVSLGDNQNGGAPTRSSWYGDAYVQNVADGTWGVADEGSYFVASNPTVATGIAGHAAPVVADTDTKALLHLYNGGNRNIIADHLFLEVTAAGTAGTLHYAVVYVDNRGATARTSGGTAITPANVRGDAPTTTGATVHFGAVVTTTGFTKLGAQIVREVIPVVQDTVMLKFGSAAPQQRAGLTTAGTATAHVFLDFAPVVVPPGGNLNIAMIRPSQSAAASYQFNFGYWER
jgi:hypothetical protein